MTSSRLVSIIDEATSILAEIKEQNDKPRAISINGHLQYTTIHSAIANVKAAILGLEAHYKGLVQALAVSQHIGTDHRDLTNEEYDQEFVELVRLDTQQHLEYMDSDEETLANTNPIVQRIHTEMITLRDGAKRLAGAIEADDSVTTTAEQVRDIGCGVLELLDSGELEFEAE